MSQFDKTLSNILNKFEIFHFLKSFLFLLKELTIFVHLDNDKDHLHITLPQHQIFDAIFLSLSPPSSQSFHIVSHSNPFFFFLHPLLQLYVSYTFFTTHTSSPITEVMLICIKK